MASVEITIIITMITIAFRRLLFIKNNYDVGVFKLILGIPKFSFSELSRCVFSLLLRTALAHLTQRKNTGKQVLGQTYGLEENTPGEHARSRIAGVQKRQ